jgi:hypothetical protein
MKMMIKPLPLNSGRVRYIDLMGRRSGGGYLFGGDLLTPGVPSLA